MNFKLAFRYLSERKLRTALTTLAIILGVALIFGLNAILPAMQEAFRNSLMASAELTDLTVTSSTRGAFDEAAAETVAGTPGVAEATGMLVRPVVLPPGQVLTTTGGRAINSLVMLGIDPATYFRVRVVQPSAGRLLAETDNGQPVVLITKSLATDVALAVGDSLVLPATTGRLSLQIVGVLDVPATPGSDEIYVPLATAQKLLGLSGVVNTVEAMFTPGSDAETVRQTVLDRLGPTFKVGTTEAGSEFATAMEMGSYAFLFFGVMALAMGSFVIFITFRTSVVERRRDMGMLRSLGASRRAVLGLVLTESLLQGILGTAVGIAIGYVMAKGMVAWMQPLMRNLMRFTLPEPHATAATWALSVGLGIGFTVLGAVIPAVSAGRVTPLEAMAPPRSEIETGLPRIRIISGIVMIALSVVGLLSGTLAWSSLGAILFVSALFVIGPALVAPISRVFGSLLGAVFAREGRVAESNLNRQPGRAAVTISVVMVGLAVLTAMTGLMSSMMGGMTGFVDRSLGESDYVIMPQSLFLGGGNVGAGPEFLAAIRSAEGVEAATGLRLATTQVEGLPAAGALGGKAGGAGAASGTADIQFVGIDPDLYPRLAGLTFTRGSDEAAAYAALKSGRSVIVNAIFASTNGVKVGQDLTVATSSGKQTYKVVGVGSDFLNFKLATGYVSQDTLARDFGATSDLMIFAGLKGGADQAKVTEALWNVTRNYPAFTVFETTKWRDQMMAQIGATVMVFPALTLLLALPSLIALVNTLGINVIERTREIGVLRAVGATRPQVGRIILAESLLLAGAGTAFGVLAGLWLGYVMVAAIQTVGFDFPWYFPWGGILAALAVGVLFGVIAAFVPARQAARLNVVKALQYE